MLVEHHYSDNYRGEDLDWLLENGFFRNSISMYRTDLLCFDANLETVINVRLPLADFKPKKRHRRIIKKANERFTIEIKPFELNEEKDALYQLHKHRFKGYLQRSLFQYINGDEAIEPYDLFETYEVTIRDGERLIAFSMFDLGDCTLASIMGVFHDDYKQFSLGTFTMLQEAEFAKAEGFEYYYPGYILHESTLFDYKLKLSRDMEFRNEDNIWVHIDNLPKFPLITDLIKSKIEDLEDLLNLFQLPHQRITYPAFGAAYFEYDDIYCVRTPMMILLFQEQITEDALVIEYWVEQEKYVLSRIEILSKFSDKHEMKVTDKENTPTNCLDLLSYTHLMLENDNAEKLIIQLIQMIKNQESSTEE